MGDPNQYFHGFNTNYNPGNFVEPQMTGVTRWGESYPGTPGNPGGYNMKQGRGGLGFQKAPGSGSIQKNKKSSTGKGDAFAHLENFSALQMIGLFAPELDIQVEHLNTKQPHFRASATYQGTRVAAVQHTKKKAKQALCTKLIKQFKLLDQYRGTGASERLDVGSHTMEVAEPPTSEPSVNTTTTAPPAMTPSGKTPLMQLSEMLKTPIPLKPLNPGDEGYPVGHTSFAVEIEVVGNFRIDGEQEEPIKVVGFGRSKKLAQHHAAFLMLKRKFDIDSALPIGGGVLSTIKPPQVSGFNSF